MEEQYLRDCFSLVFPEHNEERFDELLRVGAHLDAVMTLLPPDASLTIIDGIDTNTVFVTVGDYRYESSYPSLPIAMINTLIKYQFGIDRHLVNPNIREDVKRKLFSKIIGSCQCGTTSSDYHFHNDLCEYRLYCEMYDVLRMLP